MPETIAIVTLPGFNEIDSFVAARMIDSVPGLVVELVGPESHARSMAGITVETPGGWDSLERAAAAIIGSGLQTFEHIENATLMQAVAAAVSATPLIGSQCSGAAILHRIGLLDDQPVCTDLLTAPKLVALGVDVVVEPFRVNGGVATAGGCLSSTYLAYWMIDQLAGRDAANEALTKVAPVGEREDYQRRVDQLIPAAPAD